MAEGRLVAWLVGALQELAGYSDDGQIARHLMSLAPEQRMCYLAEFTGRQDAAVLAVCDEIEARLGVRGSPTRYSDGSKWSNVVGRAEEEKHNEIEAKAQTTAPAAEPREQHRPVVAGTDYPVYNRVFAIKGRRGNILRICREHYVREDLPCHSARCGVCGDSQLGQDKLLLAANAQHYLLPDATTLLRFLDVFEFADWKDVIVLSSVLEEFNRRSSSRAFNVLRKLLANPLRRFVLFDNDHHAHTFCPWSTTGQNAQRSTACVAAAARWYTSHLCGAIPIVVLWDDSQVSLPHSPAGSFEEATLGSYLRDWQKCGPDHELHELHRALLEAELIATQPIVEQKVNTRTSKEAQPFPEHLDQEVLAMGIKSGIFLRGHIRVNRYNPSHDAFVDCGGTGTASAGCRLITLKGVPVTFGDDQMRLSRVFVAGQQHRNRAVEGDEVAVQLLPQHEWSSPSNRLGATGLGQEATNATVPTGRIVGIIARNWRSYVATIRLEDVERLQRGRGGDYVMCVPMDSRIPKIRVKTRQAAVFANSRLIVHIHSWPATSRQPQGYYVRSLGPIGNIETEVNSLLVEHDVSHPPFPPSVISNLPQRLSVELPVEEKKPFEVGYRAQPEQSGIKPGKNPFAWELPPESLLYRRDLRETHRGCVCSIDPPGCTDIDDALSVLRLPNGNYQVGVHIADVTYFVRHDSPLDLEARSRGTSVYLVDRRLDMLPTVLSEDLCSIRGGTDRLVVSVLWECDREFNLLRDKCWFGRTAIHNSFALSYSDAQSLVDGFETDGRVTSHKLKQLSSSVSRDMTLGDAAVLAPKLVVLRNVARKLRQKRFEAGALDLESFELRFDLDANKRPVHLHQEDHIEFHSTIAEFMIQANSSVAEFIFNAFPSCSLLRHHSAPNQQQFERLHELAEAEGLIIDTSSNLALARSLEQSSQHKDPWLGRILKSMATRAMAEAQYFSTGSCEVDEFYHYGLAMPFYTHFTSPIRRYADVVVHRLLLAAIQCKFAKPSAGLDCPATAPFTDHKLQELSEHINEKNRMAKSVSKVSGDLFLSSFLRLQCFGQGTETRATGRRAEAIIFSLRENGCLVMVPEFQFKAPMWLQDREGRLVVSPFDTSFLSGRSAEDPPPCEVDCDAAGGRIHVTATSVGVSHRLQLFQHVSVDVYVPPEPPRYRHAPPVVRLVWSSLMRAPDESLPRPVTRTVRGPRGRKAVKTLVAEVKSAHAAQKHDRKRSKPTLSTPGLYSLFQETAATTDASSAALSSKRERTTKPAHTVREGSRIMFNQ